MTNLCFLTDASCSGGSERGVGSEASGSSGSEVGGNGGGDNQVCVADDPSSSQVLTPGLLNAAHALRNFVACQSASCVLVDFGDSFSSSPFSLLEPLETAAGGTDESTSAALSTLAKAVADVVESRGGGGVTVLVRGGGTQVFEAFKSAVPHSRAAEEEVVVAAPTATSSSPRLPLPPLPPRLLVLSPARPRGPPTAAAAVLEAEEDACWEADFLASDSDVAEFPGGWICPFLPSPDSRVARLVSFVPLKPSDHLLDIGCGDGRVLVAAASSVPGLVCTGIDIDAGLVRRATDAAAQAGVAKQCAFRAGDALAKEEDENQEDQGRDQEEGEGEGSRSIRLSATRWALLAEEAEMSSLWVDGVSEPRKYSVVVLFLVHSALRMVKPLVRELWERGGVTVVTLGGYHFEDWAYDRADLEFDVRVIDPKIMK
jgi:SAM-dependent methyltransferase